MLPLYEKQNHITLSHHKYIIKNIHVTCYLMQKTSSVVEIVGSGG